MKKSKNNWTWKDSIALAIIAPVFVVGATWSGVYVGKFIQGTLQVVGAMRDVSELRDGVKWLVGNETIVCPVFNGPCRKNRGVIYDLRAEVDELQQLEFGDDWRNHDRF